MTAPVQIHLCLHEVDNGNGITWLCVRGPHPNSPDDHYMVSIRTLTHLVKERA